MLVVAIVTVIVVVSCVILFFVLLVMMMIMRRGIGVVEVMRGVVMMMVMLFPVLMFLICHVYCYRPVVVRLPVVASAVAKLGLIVCCTHVYTPEFLVVIIIDIIIVYFVFIILVAVTQSPVALIDRTWLLIVGKRARRKPVSGVVVCLSVAVAVTPTVVSVVVVVTVVIVVVIAATFVAVVVVVVVVVVAAYKLSQLLDAFDVHLFYFKVVDVGG